MSIDIKREELEIENGHILTAFQALCGSITPNFRKISIKTISKTHVVFYFVFSEEIEEDFDELEEFLFFFDSCLDDSDIKIETRALIDNRPILEIDVPGRLIFCLRQ